MTCESTTAGGKEQPLSQLVESLGCGWAQILVLVLGPGGIFFVEGVGLVAINVITTSVASDLDLATSQRSMLTTMTFVGLFMGVTSSGYLADLFGRRLPIIVSFGILAFCLFLCSVLQSWVAITIAGLGAGFGVGFGMPPSIAMLSEITPMQWRMPLRAATALQYNIGMLYVSVFAALDDQMLQHLDWRSLLRYAAFPPALFFVCAAAFLPESPVYLAAKGYKEEAKAGFQAIARRNGKHIQDTISIDFALPENENQKSLSLLEQLKVVFSHQLWFATLANVYANFCMNITLYGTMYANPQIFATTSSLPPAWQSLITAIPGAIAIVLMGVIAHRLSRKTAVVLALSICFSTMMATCAGGGYPPPRSPASEILFQYGTLFAGAGVAIGYTVMFQLAVEIYPPTSSATGGSIVIGFGRIGAIIAPQVFEFMRNFFGTWQSFYAFMGVCSLVGVMLWMFVPGDIGARANEDNQPNRKLVDAGGDDFRVEYGTMKA